MDDLLRRYPGVKKYQPPDANIPGKFKAEFLTICDSFGSGFRDDPDFGSIPAGTLGDIADLVSDPDRAVEHVRGSGRSFVGSPQSPRSLVYQVLDTDRFRGIQGPFQRLVQSIFAAVYCQSERADGVFSDLLPEPPTPSAMNEITEEQARTADCADIVPMSSIHLQHGIGEAISDVRSDTARNHFLASAEDTFREGVLPATWAFYADKFANRYARSSQEERPLGTISASRILTVASVAAGGVSFFLTPHGPAEAVRVGLTGASGLAVVAEWLLPTWRNRKARQLLRRSVQQALRYRYHKVELLSVGQSRASVASDSQTM